MYVGQHWDFLTICAEGRRPIFDTHLVDLLLEVLREKCACQAFGVYAYCFMPDHLHLEWVGLSAESKLVALVRDFKGASSAMARALGLNRLWQKGFYDHVLRKGEREKVAAWYIFNNPVRKGLVSDLRDWPHSGSWMFDWKKLLAPLDEFVPPWKRGATGYSRLYRNRMTGWLFVEAALCRH